MQEDEKTKVLHALKALRDGKELKQIETNLQGIDKEIVAVINDMICQRDIHNEKLNTELNEISNVINGIADGDLSQQVSSSMQGQIGELKDSVNNLISTLNSHVSETNSLMYEIQEGKYGGEIEVNVNGIWKDGVKSLNLISKKFEEHFTRIASEKRDAQNFLGTLASELRTPLNAILGISDLILNGNILIEELNQLIITMKQSGMHMVQCLNEVLELQMLTSGRVVVDIKPFTLRSVIQQTLSSFSELFAGKIINVEVEKGVPDAFLGDAHKISQALRHILSFAKNESEILITITQKLSNANKMTLCVTIDANGIPFTQLRPDQFHACWLLVELMHGKLTFKDAPKGCVTLEVPVEIDKNTSSTSESLQRILATLDDVTPRAILVVSPHEISRNVLMRTVLNLELTPELARNANEAKAKLISAGNKGFLMVLVDEACAHNDLSKLSTDNNVKEVIMCSRMNLGDFKIMIAEDNVVNQKVMERLIKNKLVFNGTIIIVSNGQEAVDVFKEGRFDLIFMDVEMPVMNGYEATTYIRNLEGPVRRTPIIALTAKCLQGDWGRCLAAGMDDYSTKPVQVGVLQQKLEKCL